MKKFIILLFLSVITFYGFTTTIMETQKPYTILVLMNATSEWLTLSRNQRSQFVEKELNPILTKVGETVDVRFFDSEYFHASVSDFMIITTAVLDDYKLLIEMLRDSKVYGVPYFEIKEIIVGKENLFEDFNEKLKP